MMDTKLDPGAIAVAAAQLRAARDGGKAIAPLRDTWPQAGIADAYAIQAANSAQWMNEGRVRVGAKIGLTAKAVQRQFGVEQPDFGLLFADMAVADGETVATADLLQPRVEAEIAFVLARTPDVGRLTTAELVGSVAWVMPAIEIVDSRIADWKIGIFDTVADNASSGMFVLGSDVRRVEEVDFRLCGMVLERNGDPVSFGAGAACLGNPLHALGWLARTMAENGAPLVAGDVILSGALGPMIGVTPGDRFETRIEGLGSVRVNFT